jgi:hypothetical protein
MLVHIRFVPAALSATATEPPMPTRFVLAPRSRATLVSIHTRVDGQIRAGLFARGGDGASLQLRAGYSLAQLAAPAGHAALVAAGLEVLADGARRAVDAAVAS